MTITKEELIANELINQNNWNDISKYYILSEDIIKLFKDKVNWFYISKYQKLSESFIDKYKDNWYHNYHL